MTDFSLVQGGPFYGLLRRGKLVTPPMGLVYRRVLACVAITYLPLVVFTALAGTLVGGVKVPLLFDLDTNAKYLLALPLLIAAEPLVHRRVGEVVDEFVVRGLVAPRDEQRFEALVAWAMRLRNSAIVEVALLIVAFTGGYAVWRSTTAILSVATWYATPHDGTASLTMAGYCFAFVSQPIARFILLRWYFRVLVWYLFLWRASRLRLRLNPLHPDRAAGLGFLEHSVIAFAPILIAQSAFLAATIGNHILHGGAKLPEFEFQIAGLVVFLMLQPLLPLTFFVAQLVKAKLAASYELARLATRYTNEFGDKWLHGRTPRDEQLLGTSDIQSLADLANSSEVLHTMRPVPFSRALVLQLAVMVALPMMPLALTMVPLDELLRGVLKLLV